MNGWIGVDLDGTLAEHYWPHKGAYHPHRIGDPIAPMVDRVIAWVAAGYEVRIFTARVDGGRAAKIAGDVSAENVAMHEDVEQVKDAIHQWCLEHLGVVLATTCTKDYSMIELWDDRAVRVIANTGERCCNGKTVLIDIDQDVLDNVRNDAYKRGVRATKLFEAHKFLKEATGLWEAFNIWRNRARSAEGKLKKALRLLGMTEHELDSPAHAVPQPDTPLDRIKALRVFRHDFEPDAMFGGRGTEVLLRSEVLDAFGSVGTFACPICGLDIPHTHDHKNRPHVLREHDRRQYEWPSDTPERQNENWSKAYGWNRRSASPEHRSPDPNEVDEDGPACALCGQGVLKSIGVEKDRKPNGARWWHSSCLTPRVSQPQHDALADECEQLAMGNLFGDEFSDRAEKLLFRAAAVLRSVGAKERELVRQWREKDARLIVYVAELSAQPTIYAECADGLAALLDAHGAAK